MKTEEKKEDLNLGMDGCCLLFNFFKNLKRRKKNAHNMPNQVFISLLLLLTIENNIVINVAVGNCNFVSLHHAHSLCWKVSLYLLILTAVELKDQGFWDPTAATNTGSSGRTPVKPVQAMYDLPLNQAYLARKESVEHILNSCPTASEPCRFRDTTRSHKCANRPNEQTWQAEGDWFSVIYRNKDELTGHSAVKGQK